MTSELPASFDAWKTTEPSPRLGLDSEEKEDLSCSLCWGLVELEKKDSWVGRITEDMQLILTHTACAEKGKKK